MAAVFHCVDAASHARALVGFVIALVEATVAIGAAQLLLPGIGLWALLQPGSRAFVTTRPSSP
jgi:hypothetical protein